MSSRALAGGTFPFSSATPSESTPAAAARRDRNACVFSWHSQSEVCRVNSQVKTAGAADPPTNLPHLDGQHGKIECSLIIGRLEFDHPCVAPGAPPVQWEWADRSSKFKTNAQSLKQTLSFIAVQFSVAGITFPPIMSTAAAPGLLCYAYCIKSRPIFPPSTCSATLRIFSGRTSLRHVCIGTERTRYLATSVVSLRGVVDDFASSSPPSLVALRM